ncbi:hypothetical protein EOW17_24340, partial [Salmonella enterica]|nr:hypothetical protein [Salmonella enterica]
HQWLSVVTRKDLEKIMIYIAFLFHLVWYKNSNFRGVRHHSFGYWRVNHALVLLSFRTRE